MAWLYDHVRRHEEGRPPPPTTFSSPRGRALLRRTAVSRGLSLLSAIVLVVAIGWPGLLPRGVLVGSAVAVVASLAWGTFLVSRLARLERDAG